MSEAAREMGLGEVTEPLAQVVAKAECNRLWREENRAALAAYAEEVAREGVPLASYRTF